MTTRGQQSPPPRTHVALVPPDPTWPEQYAAVASALRSAAGPLGVRIDHIGSTSVPRLAAKDVIDVQVSVRSAEHLGVAEAALAAGGWRPLPYHRDHPVPGLPSDEVQWVKRLLVEPEGERRVNCHVRVTGNANQRYALLFRDYLRAHPAAAEAYARFKVHAAALFPEDLGTYADLKDPVCDLIYLPAEEWAARTGWTP